VSGIGAGEEAGGVDHVQRPEGRVREEYEGRYVEYVHLGVTMMMMMMMMMIMMMMIMMMMMMMMMMIMMMMMMMMMMTTIDGDK